jgi:hypothetical protein
MQERDHPTTRAEPADGAPRLRCPHAGDGECRYRCAARVRRCLIADVIAVAVLAENDETT